MTFPSGWELVLVVLVIMVLFGAKRLPDASRSLGRSLRIFKAETKGLRDDDTPDYDQSAHDRAVYERTIASQPPVPPLPGSPPEADGAPATGSAPAPGSSSAPATEPRQP